MNKEAAVGQERSRARSQGGKYLTFKLGSEEYGFEILKVQEIIKMVDITRVPRVPAFIRGVINLRGKIIPVIDLRLKFEMPEIAATERTCVVVVQVTRDGGGVIMGTIVDEVSEVLDIAGDQIEPAPEFGMAVDTTFLTGIGKIGKRVVILLDADRVLTMGDLAAVANVATGAVAGANEGADGKG